MILVLLTEQLRGMEQSAEAGKDHTIIIMECSGGEREAEGELRGAEEGGRGAKGRGHGRPSPWKCSPLLSGWRKGSSPDRHSPRAVDHVTSQ